MSNDIKFNYGDIIEYIDNTYDLNFEKAKKWALSNNGYLKEIIDKRTKTENGLIRYWEIKENIYPQKPIPTDEEQRKNRANAYASEVDCITAHIQRLRDEEQTPEVISEIEQLLIERDIKVEEIKERYPYSENTDSDSEE